MLQALKDFWSHLTNWWKTTPRPFSEMTDEEARDYTDRQP